MDAVTRSTPWRSMYRALIRECTYLPDPIAQDYMRNYVCRGFREKLPDLRKDCISSQRLTRLHDVAHKWYRLLHRANEGYPKHLERVLLLSYGRLGKRRRQLMKPLTEYDRPLGHIEVNQDKAQPIRPNFHSDDFQPPSPLLALVASQSRQSKVNQANLRPVVSRLEPRFPEKNSWGRPMPKRRKANFRKRWYVSLLDSVLPFLPEYDTGILQELASGKSNWRPPSRRRTPALSEQIKPGEPAPALTPEFLVYGAPKGFTYRVYERGRPHKITRRLMIRLWKKIYNFVPRMECNEQKGGWAIAWGTQEKSPKYHKVDADRAKVLFAGLDNQGKFKQIKRRRTATSEAGTSQDQRDVEVQPQGPHPETSGRQECP